MKPLAWHYLAVLLLPAFGLSACLGDGGSVDLGLGGASSGGTGTGGVATGGAGTAGGSAGEGPVGGAAGAPQDEDHAFVTVWDTREEGYYPTTAVVLPIVDGGSYDFLVDWGDGSQSEVTSFDDTDRRHDYAEPGVYEVSIEGSIEGWHFEPHEVCHTEDPGGDYEYEVCDLVSDAPKLLEIKQWGAFRFGEIPRAFESCVNLLVTGSLTTSISPWEPGTSALSPAPGAC